MLNIISSLFRPKKDNELISRYEEISRQNDLLLSQLLKEDETLIERLVRGFYKETGR